MGNSSRKQAPAGQTFTGRHEEVSIDQAERDTQSDNTPQFENVSFFDPKGETRRTRLEMMDEAQYLANRRKIETMHSLEKPIHYEVGGSFSSATNALYKSIMPKSSERRVPSNYKGGTLSHPQQHYVLSNQRFGF